MTLHRLPLLILLAAASAAAQPLAEPAPGTPPASVQPAQSAAGADSKVEVSAIRNPDLRKYRSMSAGLDEFDSQRARYAPHAQELRFRFWPRARGADGDPLAGLQLKIVGEGDPVYVPVDAQGTFALPRSERLYDEDAELVLNRKKGALRGFPYVRTPGLAPLVRRLGDHRLECRVIVAIAKKDIGLLLTATINTVLLTTDWCSSGKGHWGLDSEYELDGATIREGTRSAELTVHGRSYEVPMGDPAWSNDALIELHPMHEPTAEEMARPYGRTMYVMLAGASGSGTRLRKAEDGVYRARAWLRKGRHEFRIGAAQFEGIDLGAAAGGEMVVPGVPQLLATKGRSLVLQADHGVDYDFTLDVRDAAGPRLTVAPADGAK